MAEHFHPLKIAEVVPETDEAVSIRFDVPSELEEAFRFKAGQHLTLRADINGEEVRRNYSLCTAPFENELMVTVKRIAGGVFSNWVGDSLKAGDVIDVMTPHGSFTTDFDPATAVAGIGRAGAWSTAEKRLVPLIAMVVAAWVAIPFITPFLPKDSLTDGTIAVAAALRAKGLVTGIRRLGAQGTGVAFHR